MIRLRDRVDNVADHVERIDKTLGGLVVTRIAPGVISPAPSPGQEPKP
jgi:hypothetical protein